MNVRTNTNKEYECVKYYAGVPVVQWGIYGKCGFMGGGPNTRLGDGYGVYLRHTVDWPASDADCVDLYPTLAEAIEYVQKSYILPSEVLANIRSFFGDKK